MEYVLTKRRLSLIVIAVVSCLLLRSGLLMARSVILENVRFDIRSIVLKAEGEPVIQKTVMILKENPVITKLRIEGHTDATESKNDAIDLSVRRAQAVRDRLVQDGIDADRLVIVGYGKERPVADNAKKDGRALNRRVDFNVLETDIR